MAFQKDNHNAFYEFLKSRVNLHTDNIPVAENFILEERLDEKREESYSKFVIEPKDFDQWEEQHNRYTYGRIYLDSIDETPETFSHINKQNFIENPDSDQALIRLELLQEQCGKSNLGIIEMVKVISKYIKQANKSEMTDEYNKIAKLFSDWNRVRENRPMFAGFWDESKDLFLDENMDEKYDDNWANLIRDRLGLGHIGAKITEPIPVILFSYQVSDVLTEEAHSASIAIPTVLDSRLSPFFCPTPEKCNEGQALDLCEGGDSDYSFNLEILHRHIIYKPEHIYRVGYIDRPPGKSKEEARKIHFDYLKDDFKFSDELN